MNPTLIDSYLKTFASQKLKVIFFIVNRRLRYLSWAKDIWIESVYIDWWRNDTTRVPVWEHVEAPAFYLRQNRGGRITLIILRLLVLLLGDDLGVVVLQQLSRLGTSYVTEWTVVGRVVAPARVGWTSRWMVRDQVRWAIGIPIVLDRELALPLLHEVRVVALSTDRFRAVLLRYLSIRGQTLIRYDELSILIHTSKFF